MSFNEDSARELLHKQLIESGEKDRLKEYLYGKLVEAGWKSDVMALCRDNIKGSDDPDAVKLDDLITKITPRARAMVPDEVKRELLHRIRTYLVQQYNL
ncbi:Transcription and mRNA export factor ENY2 [Trichoplax sp. H2]|nr:Transcription and mRNA export factor ENY2 [Trichoplax sp. H2]|eukprot:RDD47129.1 Transcription and mRNA export factor ENY2 [Trichoplax sp. H2]